MLSGVPFKYPAPHAGPALASMLNCCLPVACGVARKEAGDAENVQGDGPNATGSPPGRTMSRRPVNRDFNAPDAGRGVAADLDFRLLFEGAPDLLLVLRPDREFTVLGASDAYLRATRTERQLIVGRGLFDVFGKDSDEPLAT